MGMQRPLRILCARELQKSIQDSVHKLLVDVIEAHGLGGFYDATQTSIRGLNGTEFIFKGLKHNATEIKSTEGVDIVWVEEAEKVSASSWELLIPTIRRDGSEIWVSFNKKRPTDPTWKLVQRLLNEPNAIIVQVSWRDNPFFPAVLEEERQLLLRSDKEAYDHVWEGGFDTRNHGGVYTKWVTGARESGRVVASGLYDASLPVYTAWDLGFGDSTAIWFWQIAGKEVRLIDYYESSGQGVAHYCGRIRGIYLEEEPGTKIGDPIPGHEHRREYRYAAHYAPHDASHKMMAAGGRSIADQAHALGCKMTVVPATSQANQIEAARQTLPHCWFDGERCAEALDALEQYEFEYDEDKQCFKDTPRHDWTSHCADAFEIIGQVWKEPKPAPPPPPPRTGWGLTFNDMRREIVAQQEAIW